mgnify:CR=1 FL=1
MDNQEAVQATEQQADAPLLNPQQPEAQEAQTEQPMPLFDEEQPETQVDDDDEPIERPDYYPAKFWDEDGPDVEKLAKSYAELEKQFKSGKHKAPEGDYDTADLVDAGLDLENETTQLFTEWAKENGISQAAYEDLVSKVVQIGLAEQQDFQVDRQEEMNKLGERAQEKIQMTERLLMKAPLTNDERNALAYSLDSADGINAFLKYHQSLTNEGIPVQAAPTAPAMTREDLEAAIADPRWRSEPAWRQKIEKQWMESNA